MYGKIITPVCIPYRYGGASGNGVEGWPLLSTPFYTQAQGSKNSPHGVRGVVVVVMTGEMLFPLYPHVVSSLGQSIIKDHRSSFIITRSEDVVS